VSGTPLESLPEQLLAQIRALPPTVCDFLQKPFTSSKLIERLRGVLEQPPLTTSMALRN
jgi:DNA-binding response OmpR family regulator